ncbi:formyltransferase family protein [Acutalibacter caecimuris]|uniref:formyltransferase family protein n=1 Tax=Acutalibacter caecimuris TaxID=3093657 RepID=UPI002AC965F4|nr:formyltransferase family protein [Acutalibacter sp. M00118]
MELYLNNSDSIAIFGSGSLVRKCIQSIRGFSGCKIFVFEKKISGISALEKQIRKIDHAEYAEVDANVEKRVLEANPKIIFSISNIYLFKDPLISRFPIINYHNALLPIHPGRNAEAWTIFSQDNTAGVTWHFVENKVDAGDIILQEKVPLHDRMTAIQLLSQQARTAHKMFETILTDIFEKHTLKGHRQAARADVKFHFSWEKPNDGLLELSWDTKKISAFLRAMDYGKFTILGKPSLQYQGTPFTWESYVIERSGDPGGNTRFSFGDGEAVFTGGGLSIKLLGFHKA